MRHKIEHTSSKRFHANENIQLPRRRTRTQHRCGRGEYAVRPVKRAGINCAVGDVRIVLYDISSSSRVHLAPSERGIFGHE